MWRSWETGTHTFPIVWVLFPLDSHPMVYFITWELHGFSHQIFHSIRKVSETHRMGKAWEIGFHIFLIKWVFFPLDSHPVEYFIIWKMHGFPYQFPIAWEKAGNRIKWDKPGKLVPGKILQNPSYVKNLRNWYSYFSHSMGDFFTLDLHPMVYSKIREIHGFPHQFPIAWENGAKSIELGEPSKLVPIFSQTYGYFSSIRCTS